MRRAERLFRLVNELRTRDISRATDLARAFEVSISTIYRDIAHLQASGLPIDGEAGIGYMLRPGFDMPNTTFTNDQLDALAIGLSFVERTGDPALASAAREVRAKLQAALPDPEERRLADAPFFNIHRVRDDADNLALVRQAIRDRRVLQFGYTNARGIAADRRVRPLLVWTMADGWMFSGWCELRQDFRTFRQDRISDLKVTDDRFEDDPSRSVSAFMAAEDNLG